MPLRWYFFFIGPAVAVALLWLIGASLEPGPSPVRSPLHASAQSKSAPGASAKTTTGTGNAASAASSGSAGNRSVAAAPAAASAPASAPAPDAATAANVATDAVGSIAPPAASSAMLAASTEMDLQPSAEVTKPPKVSRSSRTASKYRQHNKRYAHRRYQRDPQAGGYAYYSSPYPAYSSRSYGYRNYAGSPSYSGGYGGGYGGYGGGFGRY